MKKTKFLIALLAASMSFGMSGCAAKKGHVHTPGDWKATDQLHYRVCTVCNEVLEKHEHIYGATTVESPATYDEGGYSTTKCLVCKWTITESIPKKVHNYSDEWSYNSLCHWHECTDEGFEGLKGDVEEHEIVQKSKVDPTYDTDGYTLWGCTKCEYTKKDDIPKLKHHFDMDHWSSDEDSHWHACTDAGYESLRKDEDQHSYELVSEVDATYVLPGKKVYKCSVCLREKEETIPVKEHNYSSEWSYDTNTHWHACTDEGFTSLRKDEAPHAFNGRTIKEATCYEEGILERTCACGYSYQIKIDKTSHDFDYENWLSDENYHWHVCKTNGCTETTTKEAHTWVDQPDGKTQRCISCQRVRNFLTIRVTTPTVRISQRTNWSELAINYSDENPRVTVDKVSGYCNVTLVAGNSPEQANIMPAESLFGSQIIWHVIVKQNESDKTPQKSSGEYSGIKVYINGFLATFQGNSTSGNTYFVDNERFTVQGPKSLVFEANRQHGYSIGGVSSGGTKYTVSDIYIEYGVTKEITLIPGVTGGYFSDVLSANSYNPSKDRLEFELYWEMLDEDYSIATLFEFRDNTSKVGTYTGPLTNGQTVTTYTLTPVTNQFNTKKGFFDSTGAWAYRKVIDSSQVFISMNLVKNAKSA